ncbi:MAG: class I SAM-dependent methyltransferase [Pseudomonadota bacterium]
MISPAGPIRRNADVLRELLPLQGRRIVDVGCGDGALVRLMTREGARVTGVDPNPAQIAKARATEAAGDETYVLAPGENLPFPDGAFDAVVIFNALHHIPAKALDAALAETARVLKPGGHACIVEPLAEGPHFELAQPVDDETQVRAEAYRAVRAALKRGLFREEREETYVNPVPIESVEAFVERLVRIDPARKDAIARHEAELRSRFARLGREAPQGRVFDQPMRVNLLTRF